MTNTDTTLSPQEADSFRQRCHDFLAEHATGGAARNIDVAKNFQAKLAEAGLAGLQYDTAYGGAGLSTEHDRIYRSVAQEYPTMTGELVISHGMCLPVLNDFGTDEQKRTFMPDNISASTVWCQMFSEPMAGSDVASLQMRAVRDGDEWVLNGQKVWTTLAHVSNYGIVIARTNPEAPKHAGISMFIVDMTNPGVEVRPINQIDGGRHFNEVFFTDCRIPAAWLVGEENNGWNQATAMLMYERVAIGSMGSGSVSQPMFDLLRKAAEANDNLDHPVVRDELMRLYSMETTKALVAMRARAEVKAGKPPGPGGSLGKLASSMISWRVRAIAQRIAGVGSIAWGSGDDATPDAGGELQRIVLSSIQAGIAGGTDEIQRNIIGDRVLGLPREPSVDKGVPFNETLKSTV